MITVTYLKLFFVVVVVCADSVLDVKDVTLYVIPGYPGENLNGYQAKMFDRLYTSKLNQSCVFNVTMKELLTLNDDPEVQIQKQLKQTSQLIKEKEKGLNEIDPKTHLAKTVESRKFKKKGDVISVVEGKGDQNVISKGETVNGNVNTNAIGHGKGAAISIAGAGNMSGIMQQFYGLFNDDNMPF